MATNAIRKRMGLPAIILATATLTGCGGIPLFGGGDEPEMVSAPTISESDLVLHAIQKSAASIQEAVAQMATAKQRMAVKSSVTATAKNPELNRRVSVIWSGPMDDVAKAVAMQIGWKYEVLGETPVSRPIVHISAVGEPAFDVLRDIGLQSGSRAGVTVDTQKKRIIVSFQGA